MWTHGQIPMFQRNILSPFSGLKPETLVSTDESTQHHNTEEHQQYHHCHENLKTYTVIYCQLQSSMDCQTEQSLCGKQLGSNCRRLSMQCLRWLVTSLSLRGPRFMTGSVHEEFLMDKVVLRQVFFEFFTFPLSISSHHGPQYPCIIWEINNGLLVATV
jgi:hypothetical protein